MARWEAELARAEAATELEEARAIQDITLSGGMQRLNETDDNTIVVGISVPIPLFDRNQGDILAARNNASKTRQLRETARLRIYRKLSEAYNALSNAYTEAVKTRQEVLDGARAAFDAAIEAYRQGKTEYLVVLDAQRTLFETEAFYIDSLISYHKARTEIERLTGQSIQTGEDLEKYHAQRISEQQ
jgi:cobalt-zinc-cadmium efflux system outer membrane protein